MIPFQYGKVIHFRIAWLIFVLKVQQVICRSDNRRASSYDDKSFSPCRHCRLCRMPYEPDCSYGRLYRQQPILRSCILCTFVNGEFCPDNNYYCAFLHVNPFSHFTSARNSSTFHRLRRVHLTDLPLILGKNCSHGIVLSGCKNNKNSDIKKI